ncbi:transcriptional regulator with XRE-family HTH domain [Embleya sp. AB8]
MNGVERIERAQAVDEGTEEPAGVDGIGDTGRALGAFLRARRGRVAPEQVGLVAGGRRRVRGLRREELAQLAGISVDYYVRLEQGRATQPSPEVLDALARALGLDVAEHRHLITLAVARRGPAPAFPVSLLLRQVLDSMTRLPAFATNHRLDVVAWNALGAELVGGPADPDRRDRNNARFLFSTPAPGSCSRSGRSARRTRWAGCGSPRDATPTTRTWPR